MSGRRRIPRFARDFYHYGLLGRFIGAGHLVARLTGAIRAPCCWPSRTSSATIFDRELAPLFKRGTCAGWSTIRPRSTASASRRRSTRPCRGPAWPRSSPAPGAARLRLRLGRQLFRLAGIRPPLRAGGTGPLPPYLQPDNFETVRACGPRVELHHASLTDYLQRIPPRAWIATCCSTPRTGCDEALTRLWSEITRTARPGAASSSARAPATLLPGRIPDALLAAGDTMRPIRRPDAGSLGDLRRLPPLHPARSARLTSQPAAAAYGRHLSLSALHL